MLRRFWYFFFTLPPPASMFTGYFANWKIFDPRKLIPLSMEFCNAPIAVMTRMIENTPMVIPIIVRAARNLFAPNELSAIFRISLNCMTYDWINGVGELRSLAAGITPILQRSITSLFIAKGCYRIEPRCRPCGGEPRDQSRQHRHNHADGHQPG